MDVQLVVVEGKPLGAAIPLKVDRFVIGREPGCQLRPKSEAVGAQQCAILQKGRSVSICDLGSPQGTLLNGRRLRKGEEVRVRDGDRLQVGQLIFAIQIDAGPAEMAPRRRRRRGLAGLPLARTGGTGQAQRLVVAGVARRDRRLTAEAHPRTGRPVRLHEL